jgi:hypothetical protein
MDATHASPRSYKYQTGDLDTLLEVLLRLRAPSSEDFAACDLCAVEFTCLVTMPCCRKRTSCWECCQLWKDECRNKSREPSCPQCRNETSFQELFKADTSTLSGSVLGYQVWVVSILPPFPSRRLSLPTCAPIPCRTIIVALTGMQGTTSYAPSVRSTS